MDNVIIQLIILGVVVYACHTFYWLRVFSLGSILLIWGGFAVVAPLYLAFESFRDSSPIIAIVQIGLGAWLSIFWWIAAKAAGKWLKAQKRAGTFFREWNARSD